MKVACTLLIVKCKTLIFLILVTLRIVAANTTDGAIIIFPFRVVSSRARVLKIATAHSTVSRMRVGCAFNHRFGEILKRTRGEKNH